MGGTPRTDQRQAALRFCVVVLGWLAFLFAWFSVLSFHVADAPSDTVWPHPDRPHNVCGAVGATLAYYAFRYLGLATYPVLFLLNAALLAWSKGVRLYDLWLRLLGVALIAAACSTAATFLVAPSDRYLVTGPGGVLGNALALLLPANLQRVGTILLLIMATVVGLVLAADNLLVVLFRWLRWAGHHSGPVLVRGGSVVATAGSAVASGVSNISERIASAASKPPPTGAGLARPLPKRAAPPPGSPPPRGRPLKFDRPATEEDAGEEDVSEPLPLPVARAGRKPAMAAAPSDAAETEQGEEEAENVPPLPRKVPVGPAPAPPAPAKPAPVVKEIGPKPAYSKPTPPAKPAPRQTTDAAYELPPLELLEQAQSLDRAALEATCREKAYILEQTLNEFRLEVQVVAIQTGPVITVFELKLAPGIKVSQIISLSNDMARALKAPAVRVNAPLPGKSTIGIEVPNIDKEKVRLRDVIEMAGGRVEQYSIPLFLGKDVAGQPLVADLTRMPHLLIAGTTGSGKSVCVTSIIMSVLLTRSPAEVQMILVDPKVVELAMYKDVPHLMCPIVTETSKAESILDWASTKMDERYALLAEAGVKDIRSYNRLGYDELKNRLQPASDEEMAQIPVRLPYIIIMIDELADLMMTSAKEVEFYLCRIAQKSRAVGIHLIVSTQRPQANVVTGLIKSNLPSRIAFRVSSRLDSRIVLDQNGGEVLMGQGDMLFLPPGSSKLVRAQGTFVDDEELKAVVKHCKGQRAQDFHPELVRLPGAGSGGTDERDELFDEAVSAILETKRGSVSLLQRRFNIGYSRASRLVDQMYEAGIVGEYKGSQAREVLVTKDEWDAIRAQRDTEEAAEESGDIPA
jgi:S-DNA-T family DNA segregation ATPase FtsK/SpoIIIE